MTYILHDCMHDIVEDYVDDLIVKIKTWGTHLEALCKILDHLLEYNVRLNPKKYVFGVLFGKLLEFVVSQCGIEIDPNKVKAINAMPPSQNLK